MAVDKLVDSTQLDADLTSVANAIRTKGGTSASLAFPSGFVSAVQAIPTGITPTGTKSISANGTYDVTQYASASVSVPNSYVAGDEGKVVSNGALVAQSSDTVTANDTYDTTLINSLTVNVSGGGGVFSLIDTIIVPSDTRAVNLDLTPYRNDYDVMFAYIDFTLSASDWLYLAKNGTEPSGGDYTSSGINHTGITYARLYSTNPNAHNAEGTPSGRGYNISAGQSTPNVYTNLYMYTWDANKRIKAGSIIKIYGGNHADF